MKTIAITIDEPTIEHIDRVLAAEGDPAWRSRSELIRKAVQEFLGRLERTSEEERERQIFRRVRSRLNRQAETLIKDQAKL